MVNSILEMPLIKARIRAFMADTLMKEEFSHTTLHKQVDYSCAIYELIST